MASCSCWRIASASSMMRPRGYLARPGVDVEANRLEDAESELRRQVDDRSEHRAEQQVVGGDRQVRQLEQLSRSRRQAEEDGHRLLGADDGDGHDRNAGAHRRLHETPSPEPPQPVALGGQLARAFRPFGEHERQLLVVMEDAVSVVRVRRHATGPAPSRADGRDRAEEVVGQTVDGPPELLLDPLHDHRGIRGQRAGVVGDEEGAARRWGCCRGPPTPRGTRCGSRSSRAAGRHRRQRSERPHSSTSERRAGVRQRVVSTPARDLGSEASERRTPAGAALVQDFVTCCRAI